MKLKVCGLTNIIEVETCVSLNVNYCGFILNFPNSHRYISLSKARELTKIKKKNTKYVGVLVKPTDEQLNQFSKLDLDYFQLYGNFNPDELIKIKEKFKFFSKRMEEFLNSFPKEWTSFYFHPLKKERKNLYSSPKEWKNS